MKLVHGSLFSGFDAPSVAASWMGWKNAFHCEINPFCNDILKYWFPNSEHYEDITKTDFSQWRGRIDILTGGFPCQPFSLAGQRKGADDNRYLCPHMLRAIREIRPAWVIGENVAGILTMVQPGKETEVGSQTSLFGEDNRKRILLRQEYVVETICKDLERERYSVQPLLIPACAVGAPHRRDRVWFVARLITDTACRGSGGTPHESCCENERQNGYKTQQPFVRGCVRASSHSDGERCNNRSDNWKERPICYDQKRYSEENQSERTERKRRTCENGSVASDSQCSGSGQIQQKIQSKQSDGNSFDRNGSEWDVTYSDTPRLSALRLPSNTETEGWKDENGQPLQSSSNARGTLLTDWWQNFPTQSPVCRGNDGVPFNVDNLTIPFTKWRQESIKGYGNAIVPQVILEIFKAIEEVEQLE
ncbi:DNA cytosine methyltransferase [Bacteroides acidifaciens]|uniref:DNA cytosine methyltransferase n=1 Tax=Bacteroides acidifaciens TaxID=85831 RepID=UPI001C3CD85F|nr:DNA cytosine methyltransferase [Bacteroides acidifaciens]